VTQGVVGPEFKPKYYKKKKKERKKKFYPLEKDIQIEIVSVLENLSLRQSWVPSWLKLFIEHWRFWHLWVRMWTGLRKPAH
jgi:hypothetical protein